MSNPVWTWLRRNQDAVFSTVPVYHSCVGPSLKLAYGIVAAVDGTIAFVALVQLLRIYIHNPQAQWTRQKVFHIMVFAANFGYALYFLLTPWAACDAWSCWDHVCGFTLLAVPQIIFLATFLLLLSFWVDLCHQATDRDEEDEEAESAVVREEEALEVQHGEVPNGEAGAGPHELLLPLGERKSRGCMCWRSLRVRGRQKFVMAVVVVICLLTGAFAVLIWIGLGDNGIDSKAVAQVHADFFAVVMFLAGGGLAFYGLLLFSKMSRVRSGKASAEISKVAWLAAVCLLCFSLRAFIVLAKNIPILSGITFRDADGNFLPIWLLAYYVVGEAVPSALVLIILRDMPPRSRDSSVAGGQEFNLTVAGLEEAHAILPQWVVPPEGTPYSVVPSPPSSYGSRESQANKDTPD